MQGLNVMPCNVVMLESFMPAAFLQCEVKGVDREKSAVFKELTPHSRTYELRGQGEKKKKL